MAALPKMAELAGDVASLQCNSSSNSALPRDEVSCFCEEAMSHRPPEGDSPLSDLKSKWSDFALKVTKFWKTKRAIDRGTPLYDWTPAQRSKAGYYGPWRFAVLQVISVGAITAGTLKAWNFFAGVPEPVSLTPISLPAFLLTFTVPFESSLFFSTFDSVYDWISPTQAPFIYWVLVLILARGSLTRDRSTTASRERTKNIYLYSNAAYGFWPQALSALSSQFLANATAGGRGGPLKLIMVLAFLTILIVSTVWGIQVTGGKVPRLVFRENGYSDRVRRIGEERMPNDPPWTKLVVSYIVASGTAVGIVFLVLVLIAYVLTVSLLWARHIVVG